MAKIVFGENENVRLTVEEYKELIASYGKGVVSDYIKRLDDYIKANNKYYPIHFETLKAWLAKDNVNVGQKEDPLDNNIMEVLRFNYHNVHCNKCGKRMEFLEFVEKVEGKRPDGRYKCECGVTAQEKEGVLIYGDNDARH